MYFCGFYRGFSSVENYSNELLMKLFLFVVGVSVFCGKFLPRNCCGLMVFPWQSFAKDFFLEIHRAANVNTTSDKQQTHEC